MPFRLIKRNAAILYLPFVTCMLLYPKVAFFRELAFFLAAVPLCLTLRTSSVLSRRNLPFFIYLLLRIAFMLFSMPLTESLKYAALEMITLMPVFIWQAVCDTEHELEKRRNARIMVRGMNLVLGICVIGSLIYSRTSIYAIRNMANNEVMSGLAAAIGGGYPLLFALVILIPYWIYQCKQKENHSGKERLFYGLAAAAGVVLLIASNVTTIVALGVLGIVIAAASKDKRSLFVVVALITGLCLVLLFNKSALALVISWVSGLFGEETVIHMRLQEVIPALFENNTDSSFGMRVKLLQTSLSTFAQYPLTGIGVHVGYNYYDMAAYVGQHCEWADIFAKHGIIIASCLLLFLYGSFRALVHTYADEKYRHAFRIAFIMFAVSGFLDPVLNTNMLMIIFVYIPCHIEAYKNIGKR